VRVLALVLQPHEVGDVDQPHLQLGQMPSEQGDRTHEPGPGSPRTSTLQARTAKARPTDERAAAKTAWR